MKKKVEISVSFVGSGNLATALAKMFVKNGVTINAVYSLNKRNAKALCSICDAQYVDLNLIGDSADVVIIAVNDDSIEQVSKKINGSALVVHTSGSMDLNCLINKRTGVFYPLLSFDKRSISYDSSFPVFVESSIKKDLIILKKLAAKISDTVIELSSSKRLYYHLAAVISQNFSNFLFSLSEKVLNQEGLSFKYLIPLLSNHLNKLEKNSAAKIQTGPAARNDLKTINKHLEILKSFPEIRKVYKDLSAEILKSRKK